MKICSGVCLQTLPVPRSEQFSKSKAQGNFDNVHGQISEHIFKVKLGLFCLLSFDVFATHDFLKIGEYHLDILQF